MVYVRIRTSIHVSWHNGIHNVYINLHLEGGACWNTYVYINLHLA